MLYISVMSSTVFTFQNIVSYASRERCLSGLKKFRFPSKITLKTGSKSLPTAAVLVPLCRVNDSTSLLYTVRSVNLKNHSGQISFPGGKTDNGETAIQTALRETEEEIGLPQNKVDIWGHGSSFPGRNHEIFITPVIGSIANLNEQDLSLNKNEVAEVFTVPLENLCNPENHFYTQFKNGYILPVFVIHSYKIWGITAYITHVFLSCLLPKDVYNNEWNKKIINLGTKW